MGFLISNAEKVNCWVIFAIRAFCSGVRWVLSTASKSEYSAKMVSGNGLVIVAAIEGAAVEDVSMTLGFSNTGNVFETGFFSDFLWIVAFLVDFFFLAVFGTVIFVAITF